MDFFDYRPLHIFIYIQHIFERVEVGNFGCEGGFVGLGSGILLQWEEGEGE